MKIDVFPHILPSKYKEALAKTVSPAAFKLFEKLYDTYPSIADLNSRFVIMDKQDGYVQVLNITVPFLETVLEPKVATELVRLGNDELASLVAKYPHRFVAAIGNLPMNDLNAALDELDRIVKELHFRGIQICTDINGRPLDAPEFIPLYEKMQGYDLPIFLHPARPPTIPDYASEDASKYKIYHMFGWPYDTSAAMVRLVLSHVLKDYPTIKFVTHHCGGMIPYFDKRILSFCSGHDMDCCTQGLTRAPLEYFKMFYGDTALQGSTPGLMCGYAFFGAEHMLFGTDMPYGSYENRSVVEETIKSIEQMEITDADKKKIFEDNAKNILHIDI